MKIIIPNKHTNEIEYCVKIIFDTFFRLHYSVEKTHTDCFTILLPNKNKLIISDTFFSTFDSINAYLHENNIPKQIIFAQNRFAPEADIPIIYGTDKLKIEENDGIKTMYCGIDIFASVFFMLTRWEEYANKTRDLHKRFPATASLAYKNDFLNRPVVNEYIEMLWSMLQFLGYHETRKETKFELVPTHDLDQIYHRFSPRVLKEDFIIKGVFAPFKRLLYYAKKYNPYNTYDWLMDISEKAGVKSRFYFMTSGKHKNDNDYLLHDEKVVNIIKTIQKRKHIIGFHPGYDAFNANEEWKRQKDCFGKIGIDVNEGRQHFLRFEVPQTWQIWNANQMLIDSSLGYAEVPGFRCGTGNEYPVFDFLKRETLNVQERPLIFMDATFTGRKYNRYNSEDVEEQFSILKKLCKKYNMPFTFLFHNTAFDEIWHPQMKKKYSKLLLEQ